MSSLKSLLRPVQEEIVCRALRADMYPDAFERIALHPRAFALLRRRIYRRIPLEIRTTPLLFVHIPKNAGTSICRLLYTIEPGHASVRYYDMAAPELLRNAVTFAIVRDPIDRFLSSYNFTLNRGGEDVMIWPGPLKRLKHVETIDDYLAYLEAAQGDWLKVDNSGRPQWWFLVDIHGEIKVKHLFLLWEHNEQMLAFLASHTGRHLNHVNKTARRADNLTADQLRRIRKIYGPDFDLYDMLKKDPAKSNTLNGLMIADMASPGGTR